MRSYRWAKELHLHDPYLVPCLFKNSHSTLANKFVATDETEELTEIYATEIVLSQLVSILDETEAIINNAERGNHLRRAV